VSVVVIGGGALGLCTAFALTELGDRAVTLIERDQLAGASSGLSVGIIETQYLDPLAIELRVQSMELFRRLECDQGLPITRNGYLRLAHSSGDLVEIQHELGVEDARVLDRAELQPVVLDLECGDLSGGLFGPRAATSTATSTAACSPICCANEESRSSRRPRSRAPRTGRTTATSW
jgi:sarcosine oxidase, subunit beta